MSSKDFKDNKISSDDLDRHENGFTWCRSFVYVDNLNRTVNLVHQSAKDYLLGAYLQANEGLSRYHIVLDKTNLLMFRICWTYLSLEEFERGTVIIKRNKQDRIEYCFEIEYLRDHCFLQYAAKEWHNHTLAAGPGLATDHEFWKDKLNKMPMLQAAEGGQKLVVQRLLEEGARPDSVDTFGETPLQRAAEQDHKSIVRLLLSREYVVAHSRDSDDRAPLSYAAEYGVEAIVRLLLSRDDLAADSRDSSGRTPLSFAAGQGQEATVRLLSSRDDIAVDYWDRWGRTPLFHAAINGHEAVVRHLLTRRVFADLRDCDGRTPLSHAAERGYEAVVKLLLTREVVLNSQDDRGQTPLSYAAACRQEAVVRLLLDQDDIAVDSQDQWGRTPLDRAKRSGKDVVVRLIEQKMREASSTARKRLFEEVSDDEENGDHDNLE